MRRLILPLVFLLALPAAAQTWTFAVGGDSRNCGDVVMPAIANDIKAQGAQFYWHLGDFRATYTFDEDMLAEAAAEKKTLTIADYLRGEWPDFLRNQISWFAPTQVFLGIGNHELYNGKTRSDYIAQFGDWLTQPVIQRQRLADDANDHMVKTYYHWQSGGVDFITLDNATYDMFDVAQMRWFRAVLANAARNPAVRTVVIGTHDALPFSITCDHSMNESAQMTRTGTEVYRDLLKFRTDTKKNVYLIASHSHFMVKDIFDSPFWQKNGGVLPGVIIGTTGAVRYRLPDTLAGAGPDRARTDVYGYFLVTVDAAGKLTFDFHEVKEPNVPTAVVSRYGETFVHQCFAANRDLKERKSSTCDGAEQCVP